MITPNPNVKLKKTDRVLIVVLLHSFVLGRHKKGDMREKFQVVQSDVNV